MDMNYMYHEKGGNFAGGGGGGGGEGNPGHKPVQNPSIPITVNGKFSVVLPLRRYQTKTRAQAAPMQQPGPASSCI